MSKLLRTTLAAAVLCAAALSAKAVPILTMSVDQDQWLVTITKTLTGGSPDNLAETLIFDGVEVWGGSFRHLQSAGTLVKLPGTETGEPSLDMAIVGAHTIFWVYNDTSGPILLETSWEIYMPTAPFDNYVPDGGATGALLAGGLMGLVLLRGRHRFRAA